MSRKTKRRRSLGYGSELVSHRARRCSTPEVHLGSPIIFPLILSGGRSRCNKVEDDGDDDNKGWIGYSRGHAPGVLPINFVAWTRGLLPFSDQNTLQLSMSARTRNEDEGKIIMEDPAYSSV
jgi:hypothetical protein